MTAETEAGRKKKKTIILFNAPDKLFNLQEEKLFDGVRELIERMHDTNFMIGIAFDRNSYETRGLLINNKNDINRFFRVVVGNDHSESEGKRLQLAVERLNPPANGRTRFSEVLVIGNLPHEVPTAKNMRFTFVPVASNIVDAPVFERLRLKPAKPFSLLRTLYLEEGKIYERNHQEQPRTVQQSRPKSLATA